MMLNREWPWNVPNNKTYIQNPEEEEEGKDYYSNRAGNQICSRRFASRCEAPETHNI